MLDTSKLELLFVYQMIVWGLFEVLKILVGQKLRMGSLFKDEEIRAFRDHFNHCESIREDVDQIKDIAQKTYIETSIIKGMINDNKD